MAEHMEESPERLARPLMRLASMMGVATSYTGLSRDFHEISDETLIAILGALGIDATTPEAIEQAITTITHEQNLLVTAWGKSVLFAGCAHRGIVNILAGAKERLGRLPDAVFGGFHFFELDPADPRSEELLRATGEELAKGDTVYYTGHCTGEYAFDALRGILGGRLRGISSGAVIDL